VEGEIFRTRLDRTSVPLSLLYYAYRVSFLGIKRPGYGVDHPPASRTEVYTESRATFLQGLQGLFYGELYHNLQYVTAG